MENDRKLKVFRRGGGTLTLHPGTDAYEVTMLFDEER